jgi:hypothetical protein
MISELIRFDLIPFDLSFLKYKLETFAERRQVGWMFEAYKFGVTDGTECDQLPAIWEIPVEQEPEMFQEADHELAIAGTENIRQCYDCGATGRTRCTCCAGFGWVRALLHFWHDFDHTVQRSRFERFPSQSRKRAFRAMAMESKYEHFPATKSIDVSCAMLSDVADASSVKDSARSSAPFAKEAANSNVLFS